MEQNKKWKFVHNGICWWLRIESSDQLMDYIKSTTEQRFGMSMLRVADRAANGNTKDWHNRHPVADAIETLWKGSGENLMETTGRLMNACHNTYFELLREKGFVDINSVGGCNSFTPHPKAVEYREKLIFPHYTEKDIAIKTWELTDKQNYINRGPGYKYHYYAYLGDIQLKDGDKEKWDTYAEALEFAKSFLEREELC